MLNDNLAHLALGDLEDLAREYVRGEPVMANRLVQELIARLDVAGAEWQALKTALDAETLRADNLQAALAECQRRVDLARGA